MERWRLWTVGAVIFAGAGALFYRPFAPPSLQATGDLFVIICLVMLAIALFASRTTGVVGWQKLATPHERRIRLVPLAFGIGLLYILAERSITWTRTLPDWINAITVDGQMLMFCMGVLLVAIGLLGIRWSDRHRLALIRNREVWLLIGLTAIAFFIRSWDNINSIRGFIDEGPFVLAVRTMREEPDKVALLQPIHYINAFSYIYSYIERIFSDLFGSNLGIFRLTSAMFGALTVPATYWLTRELFDRPTAWLAALFLTTFPPHIHFSRIGINNIVDPFFGVLALASLVHALKHPPINPPSEAIRAQHIAPLPIRILKRFNRLRAMPYYALAGMMLGLLPYFYEGGELLYPMLIMIWLVGILIFAQPKPNRWGLMWLLVGFVIIAFPNYAMVAGNGFPIFSRATANQLPEGFWSQLLINENGLSRLAGFFQNNILPPLLHIFHAPDKSVFYGGEAPLILSHFVPLFFLGAFHAVLRPRPSGILLLLWVMLTILGNSIILNNAWSARFVVVFPALVILMAVGLRYTVPMLPRVVNTGVAKKLAVALVCVIVGLQGIYYFHTHLPIYQRQISYILAQYDVMFQTLDMPAGSRALVLDPDYLQYLYMKDYIAYVGAEVVLEEWSMKQIDIRPFPRYTPYVGVFIKWWDAGMIAALWEIWEFSGPYPSPYVRPQALDRFAFFRILSKK
ncbi:MAG: glycosyltransferase family 39 protein [bacterium]|nr:glycosyltransferase family 39 protein [bacterium]